MAVARCCLSLKTTHIMTLDKVNSHRVQCTGKAHVASHMSLITLIKGLIAKKTIDLVIFLLFDHIFINSKAGKCEIKSYRPFYLQHSCEPSPLNCSLYSW